MTEEYEEQIEAAEEAEDIGKLVSIIQACTSHGADEDWAEVAESSLDAYYRLAKAAATSKTEEMKALVVSESVLSTLFASLTAWKDAEDSEAIVEVALGCLVATTKFVSSSEDINLEFILLSQVLENFPDESTIQEQACLAVEGLALASETFKTKLLEIPSWSEELIAAKGRITNERNKAYPGRAAKALGLSSPE